MAININDTYQVFVDDNGILTGVFTQLVTDPKLNQQQAELVVNQLIALAEKEPDKKFNILIDLLALAKSTYVSSETRKIYAKAINHKQLKKLAVVGQSLAYKVVLSFIIAAIGLSSKVKWFFNKEEALAWLNSRGNEN